MGVKDLAKNDTDLIKEYKSPTKGSLREFSLKVGYRRLEGILAKDKDIRNAFVDLLATHRISVIEELESNG